MMETFFSIMVFGLGVDFAVHLIGRLREERASGAPFPVALVHTLGASGPGIVAGAATTGGAFLIVAMAPDPIAFHLGLSGGIGLLICLILMLCLLPGFWVLLERSKSNLQAEARAIPAGFVDRLAGHAERNPHFYLVVSAMVFVLAAAGAPRMTFETDLARVFNRKIPAIKTGERIQELFGLNANPWIVSVDSVAEARRVEEGFRADPLFGEVESIATFLGPDGKKRQAALAQAKGEIGAQKLTYEALRPLTADEDLPALEGAVRLLGALEVAGKKGPPKLEDIPEGLRARLVGGDGSFIVYAYVKNPTLDAMVSRKERIAAERISPAATGMGVLFEKVLALERPWALPIFLAILVFVAMVLILDLGRLLFVAMALVPVLVGVAFTFGALCWAQIPFNVMTTLVVPLIIGLGVDNGIHVMHRLRDSQLKNPAKAAGAVGRAIVMTTATTCISFAALLFTDHRGLESMASVMLLGVPACFLASITTLPALAKIIASSKGPLGKS
jgi:predicted RND superfamily exporter protein